MNALAKFDVFLCHNSEDKPEIWKIYDQLTAQGLQPWIDDEHLPPGQFWLNALGEQIDEIRSVAVFVGGSGIGPWQQQEIASFLGAFIRRKLPVIPVLLPTAPKEPKLPVFLENFTWVDFRKQRPDPMELLIWGITGTKPTPIRNQAHIDYTKLKDLLKAQQWKDADKETRRLMITTVGKEEGQIFTRKELLNFPCEELRAIDGLWVKHSNGHFGFSVQKRIYVECGGKLDGKDPSTEVLLTFGDRVGWRKNNEWLEYSQLDPSLSSPQIVFPIFWVLEGGLVFFWSSERNISSLFSPLSSLAQRLVNFSIGQS